jgi:Tol biopolymer transport system component
VALTAGPADLAPRFSADGSTLLFLRGAAPPFGLFLVAAVGGEARRISDDVATSATWAPDGQRVALARASTSGGVADTLVTLGKDGSGERVLARVTDVALTNLRWSPDGRTIGALATLSTNASARQSIVDFDAGSGERRTLYQPGPGVVLGAWTWSGARALLTTEGTSQSGRGGSRLRRVPLGGGSPTTLLSLQQPSAELDVAGPGRVVMDLLSPAENLSLASLASPPNKAEPARPLTRGESVDRQPTFAPDGSRVAFTSDRDGSLDIWELDVASWSLRRLTVAEGDDWDPVFSHDGKQLLWSSNRTGHFEVWIAASDGSGARKVTADGLDAENPTMTPDGRWIVYASANPSQNGIWKIHPDGQGAEIVSRGALNNPELSPDGRWISFIDTANNRLRVVALADGAEISTIDLPSFQTPTTTGGLAIGRSRWVPGSSTLAWVDYDLETGATRLVAQEIAPRRDTRGTRWRLAEGTLEEMPESFGISPDGRQLVVSAVRGRSNLLLVDGLAGVRR